MIIKETDEGAAIPDSSRQPCEIWSRVMGYHRPVSEWNKGKKQEFASRKPYVVKEELKQAAE